MIKKKNIILQSQVQYEDAKTLAERIKADFLDHDMNEDSVCSIYVYVYFHNLKVFYAA